MLVRGFFLMVLVFNWAMANAQVQAADTIMAGNDTILVNKNTSGVQDEGDPISIGHETSSDTIVKSVHVQAAFPGGSVSFNSFVIDNFNYPTRCQEEGISGYVQLRFVVDKQGNVSEIVAIEDTKSCPEFTTEAIRLLKLSPKWIPAQLNGKFVRSYRILPIKLNVEDH